MPRFTRSLRRYARACAWLRAHAARLCLLALFLAAVLGVTASRLALRTDLTELLPTDHPAVVALRTVTPRQRSASSLAILIDANDPVCAAAFADALRPALERLQPDTLTAIDWGPDPEPAEFASRWRWLYADLPDLAELERLADALVARRSSPLFVDLGDDEDPDQTLQRLEQKMKAQLPARPVSARFQSDDGRTLGVRVWRRRDGLGGAGDHETLAAVQAAVAATGPKRFGELRVRYTGPIAQAVEEQAAIRDDLGTATLACAALVLGVLYLAFGSVALVLCALWPTLLGLACALALAAVCLGALNLNTAFLISIILGNGINAPIMLIAELRRGELASMPLSRALPRAILRSIRGVAAAMLAAAAVYGVLGATRFRGFQQFGLIGGVGMVAVLLATYLALPPLLIVLDRRGWLRPGRDRFSPTVLRGLGALLHRRRAMWIASALSVVAALGAVRFALDPIEWDLSRLRSDERESSKLWTTMEKLGMGAVGAGYIANTAVLLVDDARDADKVAAALLAQDLGADHLLETARTLGSLLPHDQDAKLLVLARLRAQIDRTLDRHGDILSGEEQQRLRDARPPEALRVVTSHDLPRGVREAFTEVDGTRGRFIGIDADHTRYHDWDGHTLLKISRALTVDVDGKHYVAASASTVFAGMLETLITDAPRLAALALGAVVALALLVFGARARYVLGALGLGLLWLVGGAGLFRLRLNFMSFAAIPISIGVGADYAANLWARHQRGGPRVPPVAATVLLCSLTTIIGYSGLLLGHNGALRSFGLLCDLGELTCVLAALLSLALFARNDGVRS